MKISYITTILLSFLIATPALADKPSWAGKGKPTEEQKEAHKNTMKQKRQKGIQHKSERESDTQQNDNKPKGFLKDKIERIKQPSSAKDDSKAEPDTKQNKPKGFFKDKVERMKKPSSEKDDSKAEPDTKQVQKTDETTKKKWYQFWNK